MRRVVVTGFGAINPLANGGLLGWRKLVQGECAIKRFNKPGLKALPCQVEARIPLGNGEGEFDFDKFNVEKEDIEDKNFTKIFAVVAADEAAKMANFSPNSPDFDSEKTGIVFGTSIAPNEELALMAKRYHDNPIEENMKDNTIDQLLPNVTTSHLASKYNIKGPQLTVSTACTSGVTAVGDAFRVIRGGYCDSMLAGSSDCTGNTYTCIAAFTRIHLMPVNYNNAPEKSCRPFDRDRQGTVGSEGAAFLMLEELEHAKKRNAKIWGEILGYGFVGNGENLLGLPKSTVTTLRAMTRCMDDARMDKNNVGLVVVHAPGTVKGDGAELRAIGDFFEAHAKDVMLTATKPATGHMMGSSGTLESLWAILSCHYGEIPPILNLENLDEELSEMKYPPKFVSGKFAKWDARNRVAIKTAMGFGGTVQCLAFSNYKE